MIIGGTGFIGSYLAKELINRKEDVIIFDIKKQLNPIMEEITEKVNIVIGDITDIHDLSCAIKKYNPEKIVHLASLLADYSQKNPRKAIKVNCLGTCNVFESAKLFDIKKVVWTSSVAVYGPREYYDKMPVNEETPTKPESIYGACKVFNENLALYYRKQYGLDFIGLRLSVVYGPFRRGGRSAFASEMIYKSIIGEPIEIPYGDEIISWLYIKDAVQAIIKALDVEETEHVIFNIPGDTRSVKEAVDIIRRKIPGANIKLEPGKLASYVDIDGKRAEKELGFKIRYTLEKGIEDFIETIKRYQNKTTL